MSSGLPLIQASLASLKVLIESLAALFDVSLSYLLLEFLEIDGVALLPRWVLHIVHSVGRMLWDLGKVEEGLLVKVYRDGLPALTDLDLVILLDLIIVEDLGSNVLTLTPPVVIVDLTVFKSLWLVLHGV